MGTYELVQNLKRILREAKEGDSDDWTWRDELRQLIREYERNPFHGN